MGLARGLAASGTAMIAYFVAAVLPTATWPLTAAIISLQIDPQPVLDRYEIDHVIFSPDSALAAWLDASPGWERAYADGLAAIWVRR